MKRIEISKLFSDSDKFVGSEVHVCGWIRTIRNSKDLSFIELNDGSFFKCVQVVCLSNNIQN